MRDFEFIGKALKLNFNRPLIDNHVPYSKLHWEQKFLNVMQEHVKEVTSSFSDGKFIFTVKSIIAPPVFNFGFECQYEYTVNPGGQLNIVIQG